ncbi:extracellular solute-binding protein [Parasphaerochaeta coccoides]|nr:extracellular solute-binding protein [Parasphaerochaeta coccoides]
MDELIKEFEAENPGIKVSQQTFPYENYNTKVASSVPTGTGPNVINLFYGWLPMYMDAGYLQPLPDSVFSPEKVEAEFFPLVSAAKFEGKYYAIPTAVRSLALFWNKDLFREAGLDPEKPPKTMEEAIEMALKLTKKDKNGNYIQEGWGLQLNGQIYHWIRETLVRQFGGTPYSADGRTVTYNNQAGYDAFTYATNLQLKSQVGMPMFMTDDVTAFKAGALAMNIDGSFRLGTLDAVKELDYGVTDIPTLNGISSNFASFWANGITSTTTGKKLEASVKFLEFLTREDVMARWLKDIGELPAKKELASRREFAEDPQYGPFIRGLADAHATMFVDEAGQRQVWLDAWDQVVLNGMSIKNAVDGAAKAEQAMLDKYYKNK